MNKENAAKFLPLVQALAEGKTIQYRADRDSDWYDVESIGFSGNIENYRIKPELREWVLYRKACCSDLIATTNIEWGSRQPEAIKVREIID